MSVTIPIERRVSYTEAAAYLGWPDATKSFADARELEELAAEHLIGRQAFRVASLPDPQKRVLDATIGIRNVLAHRSQRAVTEMNRRLTAGGLPAALRRTGNSVRATGVGFYLRSEGGGNCPRFETYYDMLGDIAYALAPGGPKTVICP